MRLPNTSSITSCILWYSCASADACIALLGISGKGSHACDTSMIMLDRFNFVGEKELAFGDHE